MLSVKSLILQSLGFSTDFILNSFSDNRNNSSTIKKMPITHKKNNELTFTPNQIYSNELLELAYSLSRATYALRKLQDSKSVQSLIESLQKSNKIHIDFLLYDLLNLNYSETGS
jgi:hypothetical protein